MLEYLEERDRVDEQERLEDHKAEFIELAKSLGSECVELEEVGDFSGQLYGGFVAAKIMRSQSEIEIRLVEDGKGMVVGQENCAFPKTGPSPT